MFRFESFRESSPMERIRNEAEGFLHEKKYLPPEESLPNFETVCDGFIDSALSIDKFIKKNGVQTLVFLDRGSRNIQGGVRAAADALGIILPKIKFIDNHLLARTDRLVSRWKADVQSPILLVDEIAISGESLELTKLFLDEALPGAQIFTSALTVDRAAEKVVQLRGQKRTGLNLGYWYMARDLPRDVEDALLCVNNWPKDFLITPVARNPKNAWFGERNSNSNELQTWTKLHRMIQHHVRSRAETQ